MSKRVQILLNAVPDAIQVVMYDHMDNRMVAEMPLWVVRAKGLRGAVRIGMAQLGNIKLQRRLFHLSQPSPSRAWN